MFKQLKLASIYIGSIIGAGFASGREIILFFEDKSIISLFIAALFLAILYIFFSSGEIIDNKFINILTIFSMFISFILMCSALMSLQENLNIKKFAIITAFICIMISVFNIEYIKIVNIFAVFLILILLINLSLKTNFTAYDSIDFLSPFSYVGMNILLGGIIINKAKDNYTIKEKFFGGVVVFLIFFILLTLVHNIANKFSSFALPILEFAKSENCLYISGAIVCLSIATTLISSSHFLFKNLSKYMDKNWVILFLIFLAIAAHRSNYYNLSKIMYPILGYTGCIFTLICIFIKLKKEFSFNNFANTFNKKIHNASHYTK